MEVVLLELDALKFPHPELCVNCLSFGVSLVDIQADALGDWVRSRLRDHEIVEVAEDTLPTIVRQHVGRLDPIDHASELRGHLKGDQQPANYLALRVLCNAVLSISRVQNEVSAAGSDQILVQILVFCLFSHPDVKVCQSVRVGLKCHTNLELGRHLL